VLGEREIADEGADEEQGRRERYDGPAEPTS
jgi:hypothetical protein